MCSAIDLIRISTEARDPGHLFLLRGALSATAAMASGKDTVEFS